MKQKTNSALFASGMFLLGIFLMIDGFLQGSQGNLFYQIFGMIKFTVGGLITFLTFP